MVAVKPTFQYRSQIIGESHAMKDQSSIALEMFIISTSGVCIDDSQSISDRKGAPVTLQYKSGVEMKIDEQKVWVKINVRSVAVL